MYVFRPDAWANFRDNPSATDWHAWPRPARPLFPNPAAAPKPPEDKFEKKRRLLQKSHDAGTIDRQTYLQLVRETFDAQVDL